MRWLGWVLAATATVMPADKYLWLEDASGPRAMAWVKAENAKTAQVLKADGHFATFEKEALRLAQDKQRLPRPQFQGTAVYNLWRDDKNPRGLLRKTTVAEFSHPNPNWQPVLDLDALGKAEGKGWVEKGLECLFPGDQYCLVALSDGGEDARTEREFDLKTGKFVPNGFVLPRSKQDVSWIDHDTLLVSRDWGAGTMTQSGYPFVAKEWKRGTPLETAREVFRGKASDVLAGGTMLRDAQGDSLELFERRVTFFELEYSVKTKRGIERLALPAKVNSNGLLNGRLLVDLHEAWTPGAGGKTFPAGSVVALKLSELQKDPAHLKPEPVFEPTAQEFLQDAGLTRDCLLITTLKHVQGQAYIYAPGPNGWSRKQLAVPDKVAIDLGSANPVDNHFFLNVSSFLLPPALWLGDAGTAEIKQVKSEPPRFDSARFTVDQFEATSRDGTKVPYFLVHAKDWKQDGSNPTLLTAYGGFEVPMTPNYSAELGKLWLERGGVFVLANIRGGGEFGPAWHEAGLKTKRQRIYDDFAAVGSDLITRKVTSARKLGIEGGSNGGLLMGVELEQHPELWQAVVIGVPLLDMLRFEQIAAGASWVGEYGSVSVPAEREFLASISPYNQLKRDAKYPTPLIFTTTKDDRVGPQHARKFAAKMEEYGKPFFYWEVIEGGHGTGADVKQEAESTAVRYTYLARQLME